MTIMSVQELSEIETEFSATSRNAEVPKVQDPSKQESDFQKKNTIRGQLTKKGTSLFTIYLTFVVLLGLVLITTGIWASVQCIMFYPITTQASISVILISVLLIIVGVLVITAVVGHVLAVKYQKTSRFELKHCLILTVPAAFLIFFAVVLIVLGIAIQLLIAERVIIIANDSFSYNSQEIIEAWNAAQSTLRCCGAANFSDYEQVFSNFSVPVSCCNTTNPLVNEKMCLDIVMDVDVTDITELIYTESCVHQLERFFGYILRIVSAVSIAMGILLINGELLSLLYCVVEFYPKNTTVEDKVFLKRLYKSFHKIMGLILVFGLAFIAVPIWVLVRNMSFYYSITAPVNINVIILSIVLIIDGGVIISTSICQIAAGEAMWSTVNINNPKFKIFGEFSFVCLCILPMLIVALVVGIVAAVMRGPTNMELNSTLHKYLNDQSVQETWNTLQENMECCGVIDFTDYETVFNNFSVPVSCCNTTNPLASECPDIVRDAQQTINQIEADLIYTEGCESHLKLFFTNTFTDISASSITVSGIQLIVAINWLCLFIYATMRNWKKLLKCSNKKQLY